MITKTYTILSPEGIHARPATALVKLARQYESDISMRKNGKQVKLDSLLNILALGLKGGDKIDIVAEGSDETQAAGAIDQFFNEQLKHL
ncbi:MAG TPA: HPr family phosphocarrier protein [Puia sp.]|nr:HPr family phosphocarrier protein [Puia sp.]